VPLAVEYIAPANSRWGGRSRRIRAAEGPSRAASDPPRACIARHRL